MIRRLLWVGNVKKVRVGKQPRDLFHLSCSEETWKIFMTFSFVLDDILAINLYYQTRNVRGENLIYIFCYHSLLSFLTFALSNDLFNYVSIKLKLCKNNKKQKFSVSCDKKRNKILLKNSVSNLFSSFHLIFADR